MSGRILWLASYPKSGNTWVRLFLANYIDNAGTAASINDLDRGPTAASRDVFEDLVGIDASELTREEILRLRRAMYRWISDTAVGLVPSKIHDAFAMLADGSPLIEAEATAGAIYLVRNPLDVTVSFAHHFGITHDYAIDRLGDDAFRIGGRGRPHLGQALGTWSAHVESWASAPGIPVLVVRYEDLQADPVTEFGRIVGFAGLPQDDERLRRAIAFSDFSEARRQEDLGGFGERPTTADRFFRKGRAGVWRDELTDAQAARVVARHRTVMQRFHYLDAEGRPTT